MVIVDNSAIQEFIETYNIENIEPWLAGANENDFDGDMGKMQQIPIVDKWTKLMIDCFNPFPNNDENDSWVMMDQIFFME